MNMKKKFRLDYYKMGPTMQKIILLLCGGLSLSLTRRPDGYFRILKNIGKEWEEIDRRALRDSIRRLYRYQLVDAKDNENGTVSMILNSNGYKKALIYDIDTISIKSMKKWDEKWRMVIFDVPERFKKARNSLSLTLKNMGLHRLQKSVFVHPFECKDEIDFVVEFWNVRPFVRYIITHSIDNDLHLRDIFKKKDVL